MIKELTQEFAHKSMSSTTPQKTKLIFIICSPPQSAVRGEAGRGNLERASANFHDKLGEDWVQYCTVLCCVVLYKL